MAIISYLFPPSSERNQFLSFLLCFLPIQKSYHLLCVFFQSEILSSRDLLSKLVFSQSFLSFVLFSPECLVICLFSEMWHSAELSPQTTA